MMKFTLFLALAVFGSASASLQTDIREIIALIPREEIKEVTRRYAQTDEEFQKVVAYLRGDEFKQIALAIRENAAWQEFKAYLDEAGLDIYVVIDKIWGVLGGAGVRNINISRPQIDTERSVRGWWEEVKALIPVAEIRALIRDKIANSADFQEFIARISSDEFQTLVRAVAATPEYQELLDVARERGIAVDEYLEKLYNFFGWVKP